MRKAPKGYASQQEVSSSEKHGRGTTYATRADVDLLRVDLLSEIKKLSEAVRQASRASSTQTSVIDQEPHDGEEFAKQLRDGEDIELIDALSDSRSPPDLAELTEAIATPAVLWFLEGSTVRMNDRLPTGTLRTVGTRLDGMKRELRSSFSVDLTLASDFMRAKACYDLAAWLTYQIRIFATFGLLKGAAPLPWLKSICHANNFAFIESFVLDKDSVLLCEDTSASFFSTSYPLRRWVEEKPVSLTGKPVGVKLDLRARLSSSSVFKNLTTPVKSSPSKPDGMASNGSQ